MKILITGTKGYIATNLKKYIERKTDWNADLLSVRDDSWKETDFSRYDAIIHTAAIVHKKEKNIGWQAYHETNTVLTEELAKKALADGVPHLIFFSTMSVYGIERGMITPDTKPEPKSFYGKSKLEAESRLISLFGSEQRPMSSPDLADSISAANMQDHILHETYFQEAQSDDCGADHNITSETVSNKFLSIIRPPMIYGPDCPGNFSRLVWLTDRTPIFPRLHNQRSMLFIDSLCQFILALLKEPENGVFCPQNREYVCTSDLVKAIATAKNKKMRLVPHLEKLLNIIGHRVSSIGKVSSDLTYSFKTDASVNSTMPGPADSTAITSSEDCKAHWEKNTFPVIHPDPAAYQVCSFKESVRQSVRHNEIAIMK